MHDIRSPVNLYVVQQDRVYKQACMPQQLDAFEMAFPFQPNRKHWHTTFKILASPYNALLKLGFNPQMAAGLLIAGGTASTAVAVNEIVVRGATRLIAVELSINGKHIRRVRGDGVIVGTAT